MNKGGLSAQFPKKTLCTGELVKGDAQTMAANRARCASQGCPNCQSSLNLTMFTKKVERMMERTEAEKIVGLFVVGESYNSLSGDVSTLEGIKAVSEACTFLGLDEAHVRAIKHIVEETIDNLGAEVETKVTEAMEASSNE